MFIHIFAVLSSVVAEEACFQCFGMDPKAAANLSDDDALKLTKYWDPVQKTCGHEKNNMKSNLIYDGKKADAPIPKTWILHPRNCGKEPEPIDLAQAEKHWVMAQLTVASKGVLEQLYPVLDPQECIDQKWNSIAKGAIAPSQATPDMFTPITDYRHIERSLDYQSKSMENSDATVKSGPIAAFWGNNDGRPYLAFRGTVSTPQLMGEVDLLAGYYFDPNEVIVDVDINGNNVGKCSNFFYSSFSDLWLDDQMNDFKKRAQEAAKDREACRAKKIQIIGHSLGAAMASIATMFVVAELGVPSDCIELTTFGEPRGCNSEFSVNLSTLTSPKRYVYHKDVVPHVAPLKELDPLGIDIWEPQAKDSAFHNGYEIYLTENFHNKTSTNFSKFHSCGFDDEKNEKSEICSNSMDNLGKLTDLEHLKKTIQNDEQAVEDHLNYWPQFSSVDFCKPKTTTVAPNLIL